MPNDPHRMTIPGMLQRRAIASPDRPLFRFQGVRRNARQMVDEVARAAGLLTAIGLSRGDAVAIMCGNRSELLDFVLGAAWIGAIAVPINPASRGDQLDHILTNSGARLMITEEQHLPHVLAASAAPLERVWLLDGPPATAGPTIPEVTGVPQGTDRVDATLVGPAEAAQILYTSGTTGVSKGVLCPGGQSYWWATNLVDQLEITADDVLFTCLPLYHTNALSTFMQAVESGAEFVLADRFSASRFWQQATECGATVTYLLGAMVSILLKRKPGPHDRAHRITRSLSPATAEAHYPVFRERFGVLLLDGYGSTETNSVIGATPSQWRAGWIGKVRPGFQIRIVDEYGIPTEPGVAGELLIRSEQPFAMASGYHAMPEATAQSWQDLWFHTGDRVVTDGEWVRFVDRIKDVIRRRGENISSVEVERALAQHPAVADVAVYAVESELGEDEVMAAIIPNQDLGPAELEVFCETRLPRYAVPRFVRFVTVLPRTDNGKVRKQVLRAEGRAVAAWDREDPAAR